MGRKLSFRGAYCGELVLLVADCPCAAFWRSTRSKDQHPDPYGSEMA
jgi:hypothetical protein